MMVDQDLVSGALLKYVRQGVCPMECVEIQADDKVASEYCLSCLFWPFIKNEYVFFDFVREKEIQIGRRRVCNRYFGLL